MFGYTLPKDFLIGTSSSAVQCEGAWDKDGKSPNYYDYLLQNFGGQTLREFTGDPNFREATLTTTIPDRGCFFYDNYEAYIDDMQKTGQNTFRMSLSWPRIIPTGYGEVNPKGIEFYNKVIDKLLSCGITPFVDLYHWDLPMCLMEQGGFLNPQFPEWYEAYAKVCFEAFGDRVKHWSTFNENNITLQNGYGGSLHFPYKNDWKLGIQAGHNAILGHYRAVRLYKSMNLGGKIGAVNNIGFNSPKDHTPEDVLACQLTMEWTFDWWTEPMMHGHYPKKLLEVCPHLTEALPENYQEQLDELFIPMDFVGLNYYNCGRTQYMPEKYPFPFKGVEGFYGGANQRIVAYAAGLFDVVQYVSNRYENVETYITENGLCLLNIEDPEKECDDPERAAYLREHLRSCTRAIRAGYNLKGYYWWNDADTIEPTVGYKWRFGLTWVNHETGERRWKQSRYYFSDVCKTGIIG